MKAQEQTGREAMDGRIGQKAMSSGRLERSHTSGSSAILPQQIRGCIMDVDGTILDSMGIWTGLGRRYLAERGICAEEDLDRILFPKSTVQAAQYLIDHYGLQESNEDVCRHIFSIIDTFYRDEVTGKPGAAEFLRNLRKNRIPVILATSNEKEPVYAAFRRLGLDDCICGIVTCSEFQTDKTKPVIYREAARILQRVIDEDRLGTGEMRHLPERSQSGKPKKRNRCISSEFAVFEDTYFAAQSAKQDGFFTIGVEDAASRADREKIRALCDRFISDYRELLPWTITGNDDRDRSPETITGNDDRE